MIYAMSKTEHFWMLFYMNSTFICWMTVLAVAFFAPLGQSMIKSMVVMLDKNMGVQWIVGVVIVTAVLVWFDLQYIAKAYVILSLCNVILVKYGCTLLKEVKTMGQVIKEEKG